MAYIGNTTTSIPFIADSFSGNASTTSFSPLTRAPAGTASIAVFVSGVYQAPSTYTLIGTAITFGSPPASGVGNITVLHLGNGSTTQVTSDGSVTLLKLSGDTYGYINSAFATANTGTASGSYANSAFAAANAATATDATQNTNITNAGTYANSAFSTANSAFAAANAATATDATQNTNITTAGTYANSGFAVANSAAGYANAAFATANTGSASGSYANSAFAKANTVPALSTSATNTIGNSQSYGDYIGSRSINTTYTNSTGKPIWVAVAWTSTGNGDYSATVNGSLAYFSRQDLYPRANVDFIVPIGGTYSVSNTVGQSPAYWYELR